ncbi:hypothetical protein D3C78_1328540 [compost metagenome]
MFAHQVGVGRFDEDLYLYSSLIFGQAIAFHLTDLDLLVEHRAVTVQRAQSIGLESQVQSRLTVRQWRSLIQRLETLFWLPLPRTDSNVVA